MSSHIRMIYSTADSLEFFVDSLLQDGIDNEELRNEAHMLRRKMQAWAHELYEGSKTAKRPEGVPVVGAKLPEGLCGALSRNTEHCVFTAHEEGTKHSWEK